MKKFEYFVLETNSVIFKGIDQEELAHQLTRLGSAGWEVVSTVSITAAGSTVGLLTTLKRELPA
jgi:hypothetical protein